MEGNFFSGSELDRKSELRTNSAYLRKAMRSETTKYVLFQNCNPLVEDRNSDGEYTLVTFTFEDVNNVGDLNSMLTRDEEFEWPEFLLYLGKDKKNSDWFALNVQKEDLIIQNYLTGTSRLISTDYKKSLLISWKDSSIVAQAKSMFHWLDRYCFCPTCGTHMRVDEAGYKRACPDKQCRSNKGSVFFYLYYSFLSIYQYSLQSRILVFMHDLENGTKHDKV